MADIVRYQDLRAQYKDQIMSLITEEVYVDHANKTAVFKATLVREPNEAIFVQHGFASPENIKNKGMVPEYYHMAETRAKARVLKEAFAVIGYTDEEMGGSDEVPRTPSNSSYAAHGTRTYEAQQTVDVSQIGDSVQWLRKQLAGKGGPKGAPSEKQVKFLRSLFSRDPLKDSLEGITYAAFGKPSKELSSTEVSILIDTAQNNVDVLTSINAGEAQANDPDDLPF